MILSIALIVLAHQLWLTYVRGRFDPFDVRTLLDIVVLVMFVYAPAVNPTLNDHFVRDPAFAWTTIGGVLALYLGLHLPTRVLTSHTIPLAQDETLRTRWFIPGVVLFLLGTALQVRSSVAMSGGGFASYFLGNRLSDYASLLNGAPVSDASSQMIELSRPVVLVWMTYELMHRRWFRAAVLYILALVSILLIFRTRLQVLILLAVPLYYVDRHIRRVSLIVLGSGAIAFIALLYALNIWRGQGFQDVRSAGFSTSTLIQSVATNLNPVRGYELLWDRYDADKLNIEYGYTLVTVPLTLIPRAVWPSKPILDFENRWTYNIFGEVYSTTDEGVGVWTFTVWGEGLTQFGSLGVIIFLFAYGFTIAFMDERIQRPLFSVTWFYYSVIVATYLRSSLSSELVTLAIAFIPVTLSYLGAVGYLRIVGPARTLVKSRFS